MRTLTKALVIPALLVSAGCGVSDAEYLQLIRDTEPRLRAALVGDYLQSTDDREQIAALADELDGAHFDGQSRFVYVHEWARPDGKTITSVGMASDLEGGYARAVSLEGDHTIQSVSVSFAPTGIVVGVTTAQSGNRDYSVEWPPSTLPPYGSINIDTGMSEVKP